MSQKTERIQFRASEDFKAILELVSKTMKSSQSEILEQAFNFWLMKHHELFNGLPVEGKKKIKQKLFAI